MARMQTGMVLSVLFFLFFPLDVTTQPEDWNVLVSQGVFSSCFLEAVRTCPECRLEWFCQSHFSLCVSVAVKRYPECSGDWNELKEVLNGLV